MDIISGGVVYIFFNLIYKHYTIFLPQTSIYQMGKNQYKMYIKKKKLKKEGGIGPADFRL